MTTYLGINNEVGPPNISVGVWDTLPEVTGQEIPPSPGPTTSGSLTSRSDQRKPQVKSRKWVKKKNGLFGWITCVGGPGKSEVPPKLGGGNQKQTRELMSLVGDGQLLV